MTTIFPGTRLGPYEITARIGEGGMGLVFKAKDFQLGREVALKVLPEGFTADPERLARFEREAKLLASLNHPNIAQIYGLETSGGSPALVMELVEGPTLAERLAEGSLSMEESLSVARQIAEALEEAHGKGIVHRDLKPENVKASFEGKVKVLDFGLAKAMEPAPASAGPMGLSHSPTITLDASLPGMIVGTAAYMAPEQAKGRPADRRADIWAFGVVLFEMLGGAPLFAGSSVAEILAGVLTGEIDFSALPGSTPPAIGRLLRRCLRRDPRQRLRDIGDAILELDEAELEMRAVRTAASAAAREIRLERLTDMVGMAGSPAVSPDGKMVAFVAVEGGRRQIWIRLLAGGSPLRITHDDVDHEDPRWLPDSSALIYYSPSEGASGGHLWRVSALGGRPRKIAPAVAGGDVCHEGHRLAVLQRSEEGIALAVVALDGSESHTVLALPPDLAYQCLRWSPDDRLVTFQSDGHVFETHLDAVAVAGGARTTLARASWMRGHAWLPDGSGVVYSASIGSTMSYPPVYNLRFAGTDGATDRQLTFGDISHVEPDVDRSGRLVCSRVGNRSDVWKFPIGGAPLDNVRDAVRVTRQSGAIQAPSASPDGRELVYVSDSGGHSNLWVAAVDGSSLEQITFERDLQTTVGVPVWSPDGERIVFVRVTGNNMEVCEIRPDGSGYRMLVPDAVAPCWSGDSRSVYFSRPSGMIEKLDLASGEVRRVRTDFAASPALPREGGALYFTRLPGRTLGADGTSEVCRARPDDGPAEVLARIPTSRVPMGPRIYLQTNLSPDGRWLATSLLESTTTNLWLIPTAGGAMQPVTDFREKSAFVARCVSWSPDSAHIYAAVAEHDAAIVLLDSLLG